MIVMPVCLVLYLADSLIGISLILSRRDRSTGSRQYCLASLQYPIPRTNLSAKRSRGTRYTPLPYRLADVLILSTSVSLFSAQTVSSGTLRSKGLQIEYLFMESSSSPIVSTNSDRDLGRTNRRPLKHSMHWHWKTSISLASLGSR